MKMDLAGAMRAATKLTRAQKLMEATRVIQSALLLGRGPTAPDHAQAVDVRAIEPHDRHHPESRHATGGPSASERSEAEPNGEASLATLDLGSEHSRQASVLLMAWRASSRASRSRSPMALSS